MDLRLDILRLARIFSAIMNEVFKLLAEGERLNEAQMGQVGIYTKTFAMAAQVSL